MKCTRENKGFTLIEILILVIILGILAAIVLPQFSCASPAMGNNGFSQVTDSQKAGDASDISQPDENDSLPGYPSNNPSHPIESASARTDESR